MRVTARGRRTALALLLAMGGPLAAPAAHAQRSRPSATAAREHYRKGLKLYDLGRFPEAIREFEAAYQLREDPSYLFNMAQAHRRSGNAEQALELYRNYLRKVPDAPDRADVEAHIAALEKQEAPPTAPAPVPAAPAVTAAPPPPAPEVVARPGPAAPPPARPGNAMRTASFVVGGAGLAALGAGVYFALDARSLDDEARAAPVYDPDLEEQADSARLKSYILFGVGGAAVAAAAAMFIYSGADRASGDLTLAPAFDRGAALLTLSGGFF